MVEPVHPSSSGSPRTSLPVCRNSRTGHGDDARSVNRLAGNGGPPATAAIGPARRGLRPPPEAPTLPVGDTGAAAGIADPDPRGKLRRGYGVAPARLRGTSRHHAAS